MCCVLAESSFFLRIFLRRTDIKHDEMMSVAEGLYYELRLGVVTFLMQSGEAALSSFNH